MVKLHAKNCLRNVLICLIFEIQSFSFSDNAFLTQEKKHLFILKIFKAVIVFLIRKPTEIRSNTFISYTESCLRNVLFCLICLRQRFRLCFKQRQNDIDSRKRFSIVIKLLMVIFMAKLIQ